MIIHIHNGKRLFLSQNIAEIGFQLACIRLQPLLVPCEKPQRPHTVFLFHVLLDIHGFVRHIMEAEHQKRQHSHNHSAGHTGGGGSVVPVNPLRRGGTNHLNLFQLIAPLCKLFQPVFHRVSDFPDKLFVIALHRDSEKPDIGENFRRSGFPYITLLIAGQFLHYQIHNGVGIQQIVPCISVVILINLPVFIMVKADIKLGYSLILNRHLHGAHYLIKNAPKGGSQHNQHDNHPESLLKIQDQPLQIHSPV